MTENNESEFAKLMTGLAEAFNVECSVAKIEIYFKCLQDLSIQDVRKAVVEIINTRTFASFPKVAEIRQALKGDVEAQAMLAAQKVDRAIRKIGAYESVAFDDPVIHQVITSMGGWVKLCSTDESEWKWLKKELISLYKAFSENPGRQVPAKLSGIHEQNNGFTTAVRYVGDKEKYLDWVDRKGIECERHDISSNKNVDFNKLVELAKLPLERAN